jgi:hypothetical protein
MPDTFPALQTAVSGKIDATSLGVPGGPAKLDADGDVVNAAGAKVTGNGGGPGTFVASVVYYVLQATDGTWPARPVTSNLVLWIGRPGFGSNPPGTGTTTSGTGMAEGDLELLAP